MAPPSSADAMSFITTSIPQPPQHCTPGCIESNIQQVSVYPMGSPALLHRLQRNHPGDILTLFCPCKVGQHGSADQPILGPTVGLYNRSVKIQCR